MRVGDDAADPLLTVVLVRAQISIKQALKGEIVVKSITIEKPVVHLSDTRLPHRPPAAPSTADDKSTSWKLDVQKLFIIDGQVNLRIGSNELASGRVLMELNRDGGDYAMTFLADDVRLAGRGEMIGTVGATGKIIGAADLTAIPEAGLKVEVTIGQLGHLNFSTPKIRSREGEVELHGKITLAQLLALLPPRRA
jgi:uncharacterized protein involved in outer membrane biogenesis